MKRLVGMSAAALLLTACAGVGDGSNPSSGGGAAAGELRVLGGDIVTMDPAVMGDTGSAAYVVEVFGGLLTLNRSLKVVPDIAEKWEVSPDGKTYTFTLRSDVKFHDGKPVTAKDFVYSIERAADAKTNSHTADTYLGDIKGVLEKLGGKAQQVSGVKSPDDKTVQIEIDSPKAYFLAKLQYPTAFVVDKENVEKGGKSWFQKPNGTGPFKMTEWRPDERVILERNPNYHLGPAKVNKVNVSLTGGGLTRFENDEIDITSIALADIERVSDPTHPLNKQFIVGSELDVSYIGLNAETAPFDDVKVRQAFAMSVDTEKLIKVAVKDLVVPAKGVTPPDMPGFNAAIRGNRFNPDEAKRLLRESKYAGNLPPIQMTVGGSGTTLGAFGEGLLEQWRTNLGVDVKAQIVEFATYLSDLKRNPAQGKKSRYQMFMAGWSADYPDPQDFVEVLLASYSLENNGGYKNAEVDSLSRRAQSETDEAKRFALYQQAEQIAINEAAVIPLYHQRSYQLVKPYVKDYRPVPMVIPQYRYVSIEK